MCLEDLKKSADRARKSGVPDRLVKESLRIAQLEVRENQNCPVPDCLKVLLDEASVRTKSTALRDLAKILDVRDQHFSHPDREILTHED